VGSPPRIARLALRVFSDRRGRLAVFEAGTSLPFTPLRAYVISRVPRGRSRAGHAVSCDSVLIPLRGRCMLLARTTRGEVSRALVAERGATLIRNGTWFSLSRFSAGAILMVLASKKFAQTRYSTAPPKPRPARRKA